MPLPLSATASGKVERHGRQRHAAAQHAVRVQQFVDEAGQVTAQAPDDLVRALGGRAAGAQLDQGDRGTARARRIAQFVAQHGGEFVLGPVLRPGQVALARGFQADQPARHGMQHLPRRVQFRDAQVGRGPQAAVDHAFRRGTEVFRGGQRRKMRTYSHGFR
jgi:hypothetical protein